MALLLPSTRQGYPVPGYKAPAAETPRPTHGPQPGSFPLSASVPKSFFSKQAARAKHSAGWRRLDEPPARPPEPKRYVALGRVGAGCHFGVPH